MKGSETKLRQRLAVAIIDMQDFFLKKITEEKRHELIRNQSEAIQLCVEHGIPLFVFEYKGKGNTTASLEKKLKSHSLTTKITKSSNGGFTDTDFDETLKKMKIGAIALMGINASGCVQDTAIGALNRGYRIVTSTSVIASSSKRDKDLSTSRKWYSKKGDFWEGFEDFRNYLKKAAKS